MKNPTSTRRRFLVLTFSAPFVLGIGRSKSARLKDDDQLILLDGWVLKKSDLRFRHRDAD